MSSDLDRVLAELAHERLWRPCPTAVYSSPIDMPRQSFVERTLEVSMHAANKARDGVAFASATPNKPPGQVTKAKKAAADKSKAVAAAATTCATGTRPGDGTKPPTKKLWCGLPHRFLLPILQLHASPCASKMAGVGAYRRERSSRESDPPWRAGQIQKRPTSQAIQPRSLREGRHSAPRRLPFYGTPTFRSMRGMGAHGSARGMGAPATSLACFSSSRPASISGG
jgi:hypothetical protein